jgi:BirA family biotin operon repressor/biotin-[acetyl-CoA-carboxylase] ligase
MNPPLPPVRLERFDVLDSTNLHARRQIRSGAIGAHDGPVLYIAAEQTGGLGRHGRPWSSPRGGLWMTLVSPVDSALDSLQTLGLRVGAACLAAMVRVCEGGPDGAAGVRLKWPNDVLVDGRKILGVLSETVRHPAGGTWALIGVGVNANFPAALLPVGLRREPTSLLDRLGREVDLDDLREDLCARLLAALNEPNTAAALSLTRERLFGLGGPVTLSLPGGAPIRGTLVGLSDDGLPVVRTSEGQVVALPGCEMHIPSEGAP